MTSRTQRGGHVTCIPPFLLAAWLLPFYLQCLLSLMNVEVVHAFYDLNYSCDTEGELHIYNPNPTLFSSTTATNPRGIMCNVSVSADNVHITITGCPKTVPVYITLSNRTDDTENDGLVAGGYAETHRILCEEIKSSGVQFDSELIINIMTEDVDLLVPSTHSPITPSFEVSTAIWDYANTAEVHAARLGTQLRWKVYGPISYDILPTNCIVYAGLQAGVATQLPLILGGCGLDEFLATDFEYDASNNVNYELFSSFYVFKFRSSPYLTLACDVLVCVRGGAACQLPSDCESVRKKRSVPDVALLANDNDVKDVERVVTVLRIQQPLSKASADKMAALLLIMATLAVRILAVN